jgi:hypothetical protein
VAQDRDPGVVVNLAHHRLKRRRFSMKYDVTEQIYVSGVDVMNQPEFFNLKYLKYL